MLAESRVALGAVAARRADRLLAAAPGDAAGRRHAVRVVGADDDAFAVVAAGERRARLRGRRRARAVAVAAGRGLQHGARAALRRADGARGVLAAGARAVADAVGAATLRPHVVAFVARVGAEIGEHAGADRSLQGAGPAGVRAGAVAADAVDAKSARAFSREQTRRSERLSAAGVGARAVAARAVLRRPIGCARARVHRRVGARVPVAGLGPAAAA